MNVRSHVATLAAAVVLASPGVAILAAGTAEAAAPNGIRPCKYEDGSGQAGRRCVWDARHMGNGEGSSLVIRDGGEDGAVYRVVSHRRAHRLIKRWEASR